MGIPVSPDSGGGVANWLKKAYLPGTSPSGAAEEFQTGGQFEVNPMGDPVNPNHPGVGAGQIAAGTVLVGGLGVVGAEAGGLALHQFEGWYLQRVTNSVVANIEADSAFARSFLPPKELANGPLARNFGKVVERAVAERVAANPLMKNLLEYSSKPFTKTPDFVSKFGRGVYDVTTKGTKRGADHLQRGYEGTLRLIEYVRPSWFKF